MMSDLDEITREYHCNNCRYLYYDPNDRTEAQKCRVVDMKQKPPVNSEVMKSINGGIELSCCEYFKEKTKRRI